MTTRANMDLDAADSPEKVAPILRRAADAYNESASELAAAWQDDSAGREWEKIARALESCADRCDKITGVRR